VIGFLFCGWLDLVLKIKKDYAERLVDDIIFVHFLLAQKTNQKRAPKIPTSAILSARYT
jgi:hypothetical protein